MNSKKAKLRELRDQSIAAGKLPQEEGESTDKTESFDEKTDEESTGDITGTSKATSKSRGRKRTLQN